MDTWTKDGTIWDAKELNALALKAKAIEIARVGALRRATVVIHGLVVVAQ